MPFIRNMVRSKYVLLLISGILFLLSFFFNKEFSNRSSVIRETRLAEKYLQTQERDFEHFLADTALVRKTMDHEESLEELTALTKKKYGIFIYNMPPYRALEMKFWSDQLVAPPADLINEEDGEYFRKLSNGWYSVIKRTRLVDDGSRIFFFAVIPVRSDFFITTDYLPQEFSFSGEADRWVQISKKETEWPVHSVNGQIVFYLDKKTTGAVSYNDKATLFLRFSALIFLLVFIHFWVDAISIKQGNWRAVGVLVFVLTLLRAFTYFYPSVLNFRQFELFSPLIYGSNGVQRSLGDLLINAILFCWVTLYAWTKFKEVERPTKGFSYVLKCISGIFSLFLLIWSTFMLASVIRSLVADSKISFDVTNIFSLNNVYTVSGFAAMAFLALSYHYFSRLLLKLMLPLFGKRPVLVYFAISITGLLYLTVLSGHTDVLFYLPVLLWLLVYTWLLSTNGIIYRKIRINVTGILLWIFVYSVSMSVIMLTENNKLEWEKRKRMAERMALETDPSSETLLNIATQYLDNEFLLENFSRFRDPDKSLVLRDSLLNDFYSGYLNQYDTRLYVYDSAGSGLYNIDPTSFESLNTILNVQSKETNIKGLFYYEASFDRYNYITRRMVTDTLDRPIGSVFIVSNPKNYRSDALFPELFKLYKKQGPENPSIYSSAIYLNSRLVSPPVKYPFATSLNPEDIPAGEFTQIRRGSYDELWYKVNKSKVVVIARDRESFIETITLFSYIFCSFLFLVALVQLIGFIVRTGFTFPGLKKLVQFNIRTQVHSTIIFISIFSFLIIGATTISFFISRFNRNNNDKLSRTMRIMVNEMQKKLTDSRTFDDQITIYDSVSNVDLQKLVRDVAEIHGVDVNVYGLNGDLYVTSEANVYTKGVLSRKMDPVAFYHLSKLKQIQHAQDERIGKLSFLSIYSPVRDEEGRLYCYINIPYFTSKPELDQEISNFLMTIINLNVFIFLIAGLIALLITNRITSSFSLISNKMKEINLGKHNDEINWTRNDEIGDLVKEYNKMVAKLGESADALAKSEREGAWREMARQVAHEIKNPLTPMKLSIQYLQKAISNNQPNVKELSASVANTLVEQIDHLSKIAADFSQFANIGFTKVELFDLHDVLGSLQDLYSHNEKLEMTYDTYPGALVVNADRTQLNRLFTNLLANAVEACEGKDRIRIHIAEKNESGKITVSIRDNGEGIAPEMQSRIFIPNFTTKSSGTGLGLAMCKGIVEQAQGRIWFETRAGEGTVFFVEFPGASLINGE